jgi:plasmid stabilization system protein ParE
MKKPRRIKWATKAKYDLKAIAAYIAKDNVEAAIDFTFYVKQIIADLAVSPIGRKGELVGTTERVLTRYPSYIIIYKYDDSHLYVARVFHTAQSRKE